MNFLSLQKILPKTPDLWDLEDTQTWFDFIVQIIFAYFELEKEFEKL